MQFRCAVAILLHFASVAESVEKTAMFPSLRKRMHAAAEAAATHDNHDAAAEAAATDDNVPIFKKHMHADDNHDAAAEAAATVARDIVSDVPADSVDVPAPVAQGPDGFLPGVTTMLGGASQTLQNINSQASVLQAKLTQTQGDITNRMAKRKQLFERKLHVQEMGNQNVSIANTKIESDIRDFKQENENLTRSAARLQDDNRQMRAEFRILETKLGDARSFIAASLVATDDSKSNKLVVLKDVHAHHKLHVKSLGLVAKRVARDDDQDDKDDDKDDKDDKEDEVDSNQDDDKDSEDSSDESADSFLAIALQRHMEVPSDTESSESQAPVGDAKNLVEVLRAGVQQLAKEGRESEERLHALFVTNFKAGTRRHEALLRKQNALTAERSSLEKLRNQLRSAGAHLRKTKSHLQERLRGLGLFVQKLAHVALAPAKEVSHLIDALPPAVNAAESK